MNIYLRYRFRYYPEVLLFPHRVIVLGADRYWYVETLGM